MANELKTRFGFLVQDGGRGTAITDISQIVSSNISHLPRAASLALLRCFF